MVSRWFIPANCCVKSNLISAVVMCCNWVARRLNSNTRREFTIYSAEVQHIQQWEKNTLLLGGRWQEGTIETDSRLSVVRPNFSGGFPTPAADQHVESDFRRTGIYAYDYWNVLPVLTLIGGVAWDTMDHPENFRNPPVSEGQITDDDVSGKLGFTFSPSRWVTVRGLAAEGMGGLTYDESVRLEPSQLAGFNQAYRTVISESLAGSVEAPLYQILRSQRGRQPADQHVVGSLRQCHRTKCGSHARRVHRL
jgi:outer membrane receptor protein involved in Fe transport